MLLMMFEVEVGTAGVDVGVGVDDVGVGAEEGGFSRRILMGES
jgi:hypothetical protein